MKMKIIIALAVVCALLCLSVSAMASDRYDLTYFGWRYVDTKGSDTLFFQKVPHGGRITKHSFHTGDQIFVNLNYREDGCAIACEDGEYGYIDASCIDWGISSGIKKDIITAIGNVNVRSEHNPDAEIIGTIAQGQTLEYAGEISAFVYDWEKHIWFAVEYKGQKGWVSSKYSYHNDAIRNRNDISTKPPIEVSDYYMEPLIQSSIRLGLLTSEIDNHSEVHYQYTNGPLRIGGFELADYVSLTGSGYTIYGVSVGMDRETARSRMINAGLELYHDEEEEMSFQHRSFCKSIESAEEYDGVIYVYIREGNVTEIEWVTYST